MPDDPLNTSQRISGRRVLADALKTFMFSLSQGMAASAQAPGRRGSQLGMAAALQGPMQLQDMERTRQMQDEDRRQRVAQAQELIRQRRFDEARQLFTMQSGLPGREMQVAAPQATPAPIGGLNGGPGFQPPPIGGGQQSVALPNPAVAFPDGTRLSPPTSQQMAQQALEKVYGEERVKAMFAPPPQNRFASSAQGIFNTSTGEVTQPAPAEEPAYSPALIETLIANPQQYNNLPPSLQAQVMPELHQRGFKFPAKIAEMIGELTPRQLSAAMQMGSGLKSHPAYVDMLDIDTGMQGVETGLAQNNGFGDITAINAFQRMVDPGATVREGDVSLLQSGSAFLDKILSDFPLERLRSGAKLPDATRQAMLKTARELYAARARNYNDTVGSQAKALATAAKIPFEYIGRDFNVDKVGSAPSVIVQQNKTTGAFRHSTDGGKTWRNGKPQ